MIVKTKTDDFGNNTIGLNNPFKGLFNGDFFKRQNLLSDADITAIKAYNTEIDKCVTSQTAFNRTMLNTSKEAQNIVAAANGGTVAINGLTKSSKAAELGMRALSMAGNMIASMVISWVVSEAISWLNDLAHAEENARKRSEELTSSYETEKQNIDDSISKYKELSEKLDDTSLSTSEVKSIKKQLLDIQDQLYEKYGEEATQIDLVNGKYDEQIEKLGILSKKKAGDYVAENYSDIKADEKYVTEDFNVNKVLQYGSTQFSSFDLQKYLEKYDTLGIKKYESKGQYGVDQIDLVSNGTRQEVYDQISNLLQDLNHDFGESNPEVNALKTTLSNILNDSFDTDELANANSRIKKYAEAEILSNDKASKSYNDLVDAVDNYNTALKTGNGVDEAKEKLIETKQAAEDSTKDITNSEKVLQDVYNSLSGEAPIEFQVEIGKNVDEEIKKSYDDAISSAKEKYSEDLTPFFEENSINTQEEIDRWNDVAASCGTATEAKKKYLETNVPDNEIGVSTLSSAWEQLKASTDDATKGVADDLQTLADKGELTIDTFRDTDGAENYFDNLGYSAEEAVKYINSLSDKNSQLGAMSKNIKSITNALGTKAYVPQKDGTGASGTWGISITGNAATATKATSADSATKATQDSDGNPINSTYLKLIGGSMTGTITTSASQILKWTPSTTDNNDTGCSWYGIGTYKASDGYKRLNISHYFGINFTTKNSDSCFTHNGNTIITSANIGSQSVASAIKATQDGAGNVITSKYVTIDTTQTISGSKTFSKETTISSATASISKTTGALKVRGGIASEGQISADKVMIGDKCTLEYDANLQCLNFVFA